MTKTEKKRSIVPLPEASLAATLFSLALASGCGSPPPPTFADLQPLITRSCAFSSCHGSSRQGNLSLSSTSDYCSLVGATGGTTFRSGARAQYPRRVVPGSREQSFLYKKLTLTTAESGPSTPFGEIMPLGQPFQDQADIELFGRWIDDGAKDASGQAAAGGCP